ncbi:hypothetical protein NIES4102_22560 [Chondrocystis sp. NIES-4102]|nr:hypothetical protein NIES4102_22560 [Chondrocystis sp. NIES-4102]
MSPRKLTEDDKQEILQLYRNSEATTSTLASQYEVSSSTISRFLKNKLSSTEYEDLIQQKRLARTPRGEKSLSEDIFSLAEELPPISQQPEVVAENIPIAADLLSETTDTVSTESEKPAPIGRRRRRSSRSTVEGGEDQLITAPSTTSEVPIISSTSSIEDELVTASSTNIENSDFIDTAINEDRQEEVPEEEAPSTNIEPDSSATEPQKLVIPSKSNRLVLKTERVNLEEEDVRNQVDMITLKEMLGEDLEDINDEEDDEDDDDEDDDDEDDDDDWDAARQELINYSGKTSNLSNVPILPLSQASFPRTCYLVIDRSAELIVKPLADFADLGSIPQTEVKQKTLPVFDNHRIAKRFSHRRERVIKVPDGRMLQKTSQYLQEKGITRLLIDGRIYSL